jgi:hypothetical protein
MRVRLFLLFCILLPALFLFALDSYIGRFEHHSMYLKQMKDKLIASMDEEDDKIVNIPSIVSNIDKGNFAEAAYCLRAGAAAEERCRLDRSGILYKAISNIDLLKGDYVDRSEEYVDEFRAITKDEGFTRDVNYEFDFNYNLISNSDINSWVQYNSLNRKRFGFYSLRDGNSVDSVVQYVNGGSVFEPSIFYSNLPPISGGRVRILAISDSFGAGDGLMSLDDTWASELELQLNKVEDKYEIVALAQGGAGYNEFLSWVKDGYIEAIDPDIVLLSYFRNDFNLLHDLGRGSNIEKNLGVDKEFVYYLQCFEENDDFLGRLFKKFNKVFPNIYRYHKFSGCAKDISNVESSSLINHDEVVNSYKEIDRLIKVPTFLFQIESILQLERTQLETLNEIHENGLNFINKSYESNKINNDNCLNIFSKNFKSCEKFKANIFDGHFNRLYNKNYIESNIDLIKHNIDKSLSGVTGGSDGRVISNKSQDVVVDYLPNSLFVNNKDSDTAMVGLFNDRRYGFGRSSENFCVPFNRRGVVINFNRYLTESREVKISSEFQRDGLGVVTRGYDSNGNVVFGEVVELKAGKPLTFLGSESIRGVVVLSNNTDCGKMRTNIKDEFLLRVDII